MIKMATSCGWGHNSRWHVVRINHLLWGSMTWNTAQLLYYKGWLRSASVEALKEKDDCAQPLPVWRRRRWFIVVRCCAVEYKSKRQKDGRRRTMDSINPVSSKSDHSVFQSFSTVWTLIIAFKYGAFFCQCALTIKPWLSSMINCFYIFVFVLNLVLNGSLLLKGNDSFITWMLML